MKKLFLYLIFVSIICLSFLITGCNRKTAYSDIKAEQPVKAAGEGAQTENKPADKPADPVAAVDQKAQAGESQVQQPNAQQPTEPKKFVVPAALDMNIGEIKDLPKYPNSMRTNIQYGPMGEAEVIFLVYQSGDPIEKIGVFYEKEIKRNGWTVVTNTKDPAAYEWSLKKGDQNEATIKIVNDESSRSNFITFNRSEKKVEKKP